jgi:Tfp pilus assembly protein PilF
MMPWLALATLGVVLYVAMLSLSAWRWRLLLKAQGFATGAFVGGFPLDRRFGLNAGFTAYDDRLTQTGATGERERRADAVVGAALDWINAQPGKWFAWVHVYDPHAPYEPPAEWASRFASEPYFGEVSFVDSALGTLFTRLSSQTRPTLVIVTSDHGESLGDHGELTHSTFAYESTLHVPLIVGQIDGAGRAAPARGVTVETPVRHVDLLPTMLEAVGAPAANGPGASLAPLVAGGSGAGRPSYFEAMSATLARGWAPLRGVIVGREKFIDLPIAELYDLATDANESKNVFASQPARAQVLLNTLKSFNVAPPGRPQAESTETLERLRSLGYIGGGSGTVRAQFTDADDPKRLIELEQIMIRAQDAFRGGRVEEAVGLYRSVLARRADMEDAYRHLALVYWRTSRPGDAIATLEDALKHGVTQSEVKIKLGQYLAEAGQPARAAALLESFAGDDPDALIALGNAYQMAGRHADALRTFARLSVLDPGNGLVFQNIGIAHLQARAFPQAEAALRRAVQIDPSLAGAYTALGVVLAQTGRKSAAIEAWQQAVVANPREMDALFNLTVNLADAGRLAEARAYGQRYLAGAAGAPEADRAVIRRIVQ